MDKIEDLSGFEKILADYNEALSELEDRIADMNYEEAEFYKKQLKVIQENAKKAIDSKNELLLKRSTDQIRNLLSKIVTKDPEFWIGAFMYFSEQSGFSDPQKARQIINIGYQALERGDIETIKMCAAGLFHLLPQEAQANFVTKQDTSGITR